MAEKALCSIPGCGNKVLCRTWCNKHYLRWQKHGDPTAFKQKTAQGVARSFLDDAIRSQTDDCIVWPFNVTWNGYGMFWHQGRMQPASRVSCGLAYGAPPTERHEAAHSCNNRACVNPRHLRWATASENAADRIQHGTSNRGSQSPHAKLTEADVLEMRKLRKETKITYRELGERYGVSTSAAGHAVSGVWWKWLEG